jgi:hypothetical protein
MSKKNFEKEPAVAPAYLTSLDIKTSNLICYDDANDPDTGR